MSKDDKEIQVEESEIEVFRTEPNHVGFSLERRDSNLCSNFNWISDYKKKQKTKECRS